MERGVAHETARRSNLRCDSKFIAFFRPDPSFLIPAKLSHQLGEKLALLLLRNMSAVSQDDEARIQDLVMEFVAGFDRYDRIFLTPDDQGWLVDEMGVFLDALRMPVS